MDNIVNITLHGHLGEAIGSKWRLAVKSVREAVHAIQILSKQKLYRYLINKDKEGARYKILVNNTPISHEVNFINEKNIDEAFKTELIMNNENLQSIDIVPIIEGTDAKILGAILIVIGIILIATGVAAPAGATVTSLGISLTATYLAAIVLIAGGIAMMLSKPPEFGRFREIDKTNDKSYFFNGPINITQEGGPVPMGYGELLVGSQVISAGISIAIRILDSVQIFSSSDNLSTGGGFGGGLRRVYIP